MTENRVKCVALHPDAVLNMFREVNLNIESITQLRFEGLPDNVVVRNCHFDPSRQALVFIVYHESFSEILQSEMPEIIHGIFRTVKFRIPAFEQYEKMKELGIKDFDDKGHPVYEPQVDWKLLYEKQMIAMAGAGIVGWNDKLEPVFKPKSRRDKILDGIRSMFS